MTPEQKILHFASVDIGSNAVRLLLCNVYGYMNPPLFKKAELIRFPLRLGEEAFTNGLISDSTISQLVKVMMSFKLLIDAFDAISYRVCATSAMREAANSSKVIEIVRQEAGINIEIIPGKLEAEIIYSNHIAEQLDDINNYLYIDVGGGSTEITLFSHGKIISSASYNIGTIRMLHDMISRDQWMEFKDQVKFRTSGYKPLVAIGSGGNINRIFKLANKKEGQFMSFSKLKESYDYVKGFSYEQRMSILKLNPDRADVIIPAYRIFIAVMKAANVEKIMVPQIGLSDGIIHLLYDEYLAKNYATSY